jgi:ATP dependent DNA ligase domain
LIGNRRSGGLCLATGAHPAPRQERILYQPLARTDDGLGRPRWRRFGAGNLTRLCPGGAGISEIMSLGPRSLPAGFIAPCLPTSAPLPPSGESWLHEIKHDGFRVIARKVGERVRLYSRPGNDLTYRFPLIVEALDTCTCSPASSMEKPSHAGMMGLRALIASDTADTTPMFSCGRSI